MGQKVEHPIKTMETGWRIVMVEGLYKLLRNDVVVATDNDLAQIEKKYRTMSGH